MLLQVEIFLFFNYVFFTSTHFPSITRVLKEIVRPLKLPFKKNIMETTWALVLFWRTIFSQIAKYHRVELENIVSCVFYINHSFYPQPKTQREPHEKS